MNKTFGILAPITFLRKKYFNKDYNKIHYLSEVSDLRPSILSTTSSSSICSMILDFPEVSLISVVLILELTESLFGRFFLGDSSTSGLSGMAITVDKSCVEFLNSFSVKN